MSAQTSTTWLVVTCALLGACAPRGVTGAPSPPTSALWNDGWVDPSPHRGGYVQVTDGTWLHYLDWGGAGDPLLFLTGFGLSAHIYDDLAPSFTDRFHVLALDRRGHGESDHPEGGYTTDRTIKDIRDTLDRLHIRRAVLVGHSHGGWEISQFASRFPTRVLKLIYIDGTLDTRMSDVIARDPVHRPDPDAINPTAVRSWFQKYWFGRWSNALEANLRHLTVDDAKWKAIDQEARSRPVDYSKIRGPALALYAIATLQNRYPWLDPIRDTAQVQAAESFIRDSLNPVEEAGAEEFRRAIPNGKTIRIVGHHYLFITNEAAVVGAMKAFLGYD